MRLGGSLVGVLVYGRPIPKKSWQIFTGALGEQKSAIINHNNEEKRSFSTLFFNRLQINYCFELFVVYGCALMCQPFFGSLMWHYAYFAGSITSLCQKIDVLCFGSVFILYSVRLIAGWEMIRAGLGVDNVQNGATCVPNYLFFVAIGRYLAVIRARARAQ